MSMKKIRLIQQYFFIVVGVLLMDIGYYYFILPIRVVAGGSTGLAQILNDIFPKIPISIYSFIFNMIFLLAGGLILGKKYFLNSILGSVLYPAIMWVFEQITPLESLYTGIDITAQALLFSILGGILIGISQAILVRNGGNTGGTDIPIQIANKYFHVPLSLSVYLIDGTIVFAGWFSTSTGSFINTLYAILIIYICGLVSDKTLMLVSGNQKSCNIVTKKSEEIKQAIFDRIDRGVTLIDCKGGYKGEEKTVLVCVVANNQLHTLYQIIQDIDKEAFTYVYDAAAIKGNWRNKKGTYD